MYHVLPKWWWGQWKRSFRCVENIPLSYTFISAWHATYTSGCHYICYYARNVKLKRNAFNRELRPTICHRRTLAKVFFVSPRIRKNWWPPTVCSFTSVHQTRARHSSHHRYANCESIIVLITHKHHDAIHATMRVPILSLTSKSQISYI